MLTTSAIIQEAAASAPAGIIDVTWTDLALAFGLILMAIGASRWRRLDLESGFIVGAIRAVVQLVAVGYILVYIFAADQWWLGASSRAVLSSLFRRVAAQVGIGIVAGNILVAVLLNIMIGDIRPAVVLPPMAAASLVMLVVGLCACVAPALRALRIQPTEALRTAR